MRLKICCWQLNLHTLHKIWREPKCSNFTTQIWLKIDICIIPDQAQQQKQAPQDTTNPHSSPSFIKEKHRTKHRTKSKNKNKNKSKTRRKEIQKSMSKEKTLTLQKETPHWSETKKKENSNPFFLLVMQLQSCNPKTILRILTVHTLLHIRPPPTHPLKTTKSHKQIQHPKPRMHAKLQSQKAAKQ
jgi:nucleosome binding factor SPN SPT16 subunit